MPLLMCPNCNESMSAVIRQEIEIDMCPTCRGVWLDRGELEKLLDLAGREAAEQAAIANRGREPIWGERDPPERTHRRKGRNRGFDLFDIFD